MLELFGRERPFLINHRVARPDLAEIVEPAGHPNVVNHFFGQSHLGRNIRGQVRHSRRMTP